MHEKTHSGHTKPRFASQAVAKNRIKFSTMHLTRTCFQLT